MPAQLKLQILKAVAAWDYRTLSEESGIAMLFVQSAFVGRGQANISYLYDFMLSRLASEEVGILFEVLADIHEFIERSPPEVDTGGD